MDPWESILNAVLNGIIISLLASMQYRWMWEKQTVGSPPKCRIDAVIGVVLKYLHLLLVCERGYANRMYALWN